MSSLSFLARDELGGESPSAMHHFVSECFVTHGGCREDHKSKPLVLSFHLLSQRVKGKGSGLMKHSYAAHIVFKGPPVCVHVSL